MTTPPPSPAPAKPRRWLIAAGVGAILVVLGFVLNDLFLGDFQAPIDYAEYWTAGRLNARGQNPYDGTLVRETQRELGLDSTAIMMWNPPWALTLVMPIGALPFQASYGLWVLLTVAFVLVSATWLWTAYGGSTRRLGIAFVLTFSFVPTIFLLGSGQITGFILVGLAGFLAASRAGRPYLAGAAVAYTALKPQLLGLLALWLVYEGFRSGRGRRVVLGGVAVGLLACVPPTLTNPDVWSQYLAATTGGSSADHHDLSHWEPPLIGWWLRTSIPGAPFAVQFLPFALAAVAFTVWCWRASPDRDETTGERLPWIVGLSLLAAPYGVWSFDMILLLVPVLAAAARLVERPTRVGLTIGIGGWLVVNGVLLTFMVNHVTSRWYVWFTPAVLALCWTVVRATKSTKS